MSEYYIKNGELYHYGVIGMKWGVRRYQNKDGSLTPAGKRKQQRLQARNDRVEKHVTAYTDKTLAGRVKNRSKIESKYDKKIAKSIETNNKNKTKELQSIKKYKLKDFDEGTTYIKKALKIREENYTGLGKLKIKAISNPEIKNSPEYKRAKKYYKTQCQSDYMWGSAVTTLQEARFIAIDNGTSWTRDVLDNKKNK